MTKIFIDGEYGTTGLKIRERLANDSNFTLLSIAYDERHDKGARQDCAHSADIVILCLPDEAAREMVQNLKHSLVRIIDSSSAHRTDPDWVYGFAEMTPNQAEAIKKAQYVANPGCYATGAIALLRPLREKGLLSDHAPLTINAISGYSGGGKALISEMEQQPHDGQSGAVINYFAYSLKLQHKHIKEIKKFALLKRSPLFTPNVGRFCQGMIVNIPLPLEILQKEASFEQLWSIFSEHYQASRYRDAADKAQSFVEIATPDELAAIERLNPQSLANEDRLKIYIFYNKEEKLANLCAVLDNLGKGASGAAIQNLKLMAGIEL